MTNPLLPPAERQSGHINNGSLSLREAADKTIRQFETSQNMLAHTLDGWCVWPVLRFSIFSKLEGLQARKVVKHNSLSYPQRLAIAYSDLRRLISLPQSEIICLVQSSNRSESIGGKFKDIYFDDLLSQCSSYVKVENLVNRHYLPRSENALLPSHLTSTVVRLGVGALLRLPKPADIVSVSAQISQQVVSELGLAEYSPEWIATLLANFYWSKRLYKRFFSHFKPRRLLLTTAYTYHAPVAAAKELGIQVIEFQHGLIDPYHNGYSWTEAAQQYKTNMPTPDKLFLYGDHWKDVLSQRGFWNTELVSVGSARMDQYRQIFPEITPSGKVKLVVTTQNIDIQPMIDFFTHFCNLAEGVIDYHLTFKLHPGENDKSRYNSAFGENNRVAIFLGTESPSTYELIVNSDWHLSIYSTCHYEALELGVPTIILPFSNHQAVMHLYNASSAYFSASPEDLVSIIKNNPKQHVPAHVGDYYFKPGAVENVLREIGV